MKRRFLEKNKNRIINLNAVYVGIFGALASCGVILANGNLDVLNFRVVPVVGLVAFASWRILQEDLEDYKISNLNLMLLIAGGGVLKYLNSGVGLYPWQALVIFLIGWGLFKAFEGEIGGGDVRLATVAGLFLNLVQLLAGISLAASVGILIGVKFKIKRIPFGALLIIALWLSFGIVRF